MPGNNVSVAFLMADYGHDPTETAVPFKAFVNAGFAVTFVTERGDSPRCDSKMLTGWTGSLLGASQPAKDAYSDMTNSPQWQRPSSWQDKEFMLNDFDILFLPGGHDQAIRQLLDSSEAQDLVASYWSQIKRPSRKTCAAVCHGVQLLAHTKLDGQSVLYDATTTALTGLMETSIFWTTRLFLGDYYKTYGAQTPNVQDVVKASLKDPSTQFKTIASMSQPFVVEDERYNYFSGRFPGDAQALADKVIEHVKGLVSVSI